VKSVDDVFKNTKDLTLGWGDPNSTSGTLIPGYYLFAKHGVSVNASNFKTVLPSSHEANLLAVVNNKVDIATNNTIELATLQKKNPERFAQVRVLWTSPLIPSDPLVYRKDLPEATKQKLRDFFYHYAKTDPREQKIMADITGFAGFAPSTDAQLLPIRQVALFQQKEKIAADTHLSDDDRKSQIAAIDAITASPSFLFKASINVSKRRICTVQATFISSQTMRARSTLKPAGLPSGPA